MKFEFCGLVLSRFRCFASTLSARARARARAPTVGPGSPGSLSASGASPLAFVESESPLFRARSRLVRTSKIFCWISYALALCVEKCYIERNTYCFVKVPLQGVNLYLLETVRNSTLWGSVPKRWGFNSGYNLATSEILGI